MESVTANSCQVKVDRAGDEQSNNWKERALCSGKRGKDGKAEKVAAI
jgi:hypothetical protein